ncbi:MAG: hypothetical protein J6R88_02840 [Clostridia bacterium]|nr:hypothetical protein [Clostridia bacterium]
MRLSLYKNLLPDSNSQTTLELRHFIEGGAILFDPNDKYPIWKEEHRAVLEKKIIEHYYNQQIGFETFGRFKFELNVKMREIMPYYVDIYKTTQYDYNPIENYAMQEEFEDSSKTNTKNSSNSLEKFSDTPMSSIDNLDDHLTNATRNDHKGTADGTSDNKHKGWRKGNIGVTTSQQMIEQERKITLNLDVMIINELQTLFLGVL